MVQSLFREATCSNPVFSRVLFFFEISTCNRLCFQRFWVNLPPVAAIHKTNGPFSIIKEQLQPHILSNYCIFSRQEEFSQGYQSSSMVPPWFQASINWMEACYLTTSVPAIYSFYGTLIFSLEHLSRALLLSLWLIRENSKGTVFIWGKQLVPLYSTELVAVIFVCSHPMMNVLIWQIRFYWFELAAIHNICSKNDYSLHQRITKIKANTLWLRSKQRIKSI